MHHHMKMGRKARRVKREGEPSLAGSAPAIQRICIEVMTDFVSLVHVLVLIFGGGFCLFLIKKNTIPAKAGCAKLVFKNHRSV